MNVPIVIPIIVTSIDTSSGTAIAGEILSGKIAWVDGSEVTGTMPNNSGDVNAVSYHQTGTSLHIVPAEGYVDGVDDAVVITDSDFTAANIANGVSIFGLTGMLTGGSILMGDVTPASSVRGISVTHNFGAIPSHVFFCCLDQTVRNKKCYFSGGGIPNVSHFYFARSVGDEIDFQARTNALTGASDEDNPCAICDLTTTTMTIGNTGQEDYVLEAGVKYYWLMW